MNKLFGSLTRLFVNLTYFYLTTTMKNVRLYMILQWVFFLPVILPLCIAFGALQGAYQMAERVIEQLWADVVSEQSANRAISTE